MVRLVDPCAKLLFNDPEIHGVEPEDGHDNHIHVTWSLNNPIPTPVLMRAAEERWKK